MSDSASGDSDVQDFKDLDMIFELARLEQQQEEEAERVRHRNYIYRERVEAEARLMADYFGPRPKYPDYYFRLRISEDTKETRQTNWRSHSRAFHPTSSKVLCLHLLMIAWFVTSGVSPIPANGAISPMSDVPLVHLNYQES
ncbi:hypothetical protein Tco_1172677 [Tanacetum coccineum]